MPHHTLPSSPKSSQETLHTVHDCCFRSLMRQEKMAKAFPLDAAIKSRHDGDKEMLVKSTPPYGGQNSGIQERS